MAGDGGLGDVVLLLGPAPPLGGLAGLAVQALGLGPDGTKLPLDLLEQPDGGVGVGAELGPQLGDARP